MNLIEKTYILDEKQQKVAVQIPIKDFEKIEQLLEDYALGQIMKENEKEDNLSVREAKAYYQKLKKA